MISSWRSRRVLPDQAEWRKWSGSWKFTAVNPISLFEANDGEDNAEDEDMPASMKFTFEPRRRDRA
jgi:hypothetical protein